MPFNVYLILGYGRIINFQHVCLIVFVYVYKHSIRFASSHHHITSGVLQVRALVGIYSK
jgi:hypothetical protein